MHFVFGVEPKPTDIVLFFGEDNFDLDDVVRNALVRFPIFGLEVALAAIAVNQSKRGNKPVVEVDGDWSQLH